MKGRIIVNKLEVIENKFEEVCKALDEGYPCNEFETEAQLSAYMEGIEFVKDTLSSRCESSLWEVTFVDTSKIQIKGSDIFSVIFELSKLGYAYEEVVTFNCLPEDINN